jgi:hypothetical protein
VSDAEPQSYEIHFDRIGQWVRDESARFDGIGSPAELAAAVARFAARKLVTRDVTVTVDLAAGQVFLGPGGRSGSGRIIAPVVNPHEPPVTGTAGR